MTESLLPRAIAADSAGPALGPEPEAGWTDFQADGIDPEAVAAAIRHQIDQDAIWRAPATPRPPNLNSRSRASQRARKKFSKSRKKAPGRKADTADKADSGARLYTFTYRPKTG